MNELKQNEIDKNKQRILFAVWIIYLLLVYIFLSFLKVNIFVGNFIYYIISLLLSLYGLKIIIFQSATVLSRQTAHPDLFSVAVTHWLFWNKIKITGSLAALYGCLFLILGIGLFVGLIIISSQIIL